MRERFYQRRAMRGHRRVAALATFWTHSRRARRRTLGLVLCALVAPLTGCAGTPGTPGTSGAPGTPGQQAAAPVQPSTSPLAPRTPLPGHHIGLPTLGPVTIAAPARPLPACARVAHPIARPRDFPATFPLPAGTVFTSLQHRAGGIVVEGMTPLDFAPMVRYFITALLQAGYRLFQSESEPPYDAESEFQGHGYIGRWRTRAVLSCPGVIDVTIYALTYPQAR